MSRDRLPYAKNTNRVVKSSKILGSGGPRDIQRRRAVGVINGPKIDSATFEELKRLIEERTSASAATTQSFDGLPYEEVEKKLQEAVKATREEEALRYESGLESLNEQLNAAKTKIALMEQKINENINEKSVELLKNEIRDRDDELAAKNKKINELENALETQDVPKSIKVEINNYKKEISKLKTQLNSFGAFKTKLSAKDDKINELNTSIKLKDNEIKMLRKELDNALNKSNKADKDILEMRATMELIFEKISTMSAANTINTEDSNIPSIDDNKVFIDPSDVYDGLQPHIDIEASTVVGAGRNVQSDANKLKNLLNKKEFKPGQLKNK